MSIKHFVTSAFWEKHDCLIVHTYKWDGTLRGLFQSHKWAWNPFKRLPPPCHWALILSERPCQLWFSTLPFSGKMGVVLTIKVLQKYHMLCHTAQSGHKQTAYINYLLHFSLALIVMISLWYCPEYMTVDGVKWLDCGQLDTMHHTFTSLSTQLEKHIFVNTIVNIVSLLSFYKVWFNVFIVHFIMCKLNISTHSSTN